jgi:hypothetical protein
VRSYMMAGARGPAKSSRLKQRLQTQMLPSLLAIPARPRPAHLGLAPPTKIMGA